MLEDLVLVLTCLLIMRLYGKAEGTQGAFIDFFDADIQASNG